MKTYILVYSDWHTHFTFGLLNPATVLMVEDIEGERREFIPRLTYTQELLWEFYLADIARIKSIIGDSDLMILHLGDMCHGAKYPSQLVTTRMSDQVTSAAYNLKPLLGAFKNNIRVVRGAFGTEAHNFGEGSAEDLIFQQIKAMGIDAEMTYHGLVTWDGVDIDYAHHGPGPGIRDWLGGNNARYYLRDVMEREVGSGKKPPDIVLRGHFHTPIRERLDAKGHTSSLYIIPSYCGVSGHSHQAAKSPARVTVGCSLFECDNGAVVFDHFKEFEHTIDIRKKEKFTYGYRPTERIDK